MTCVTHARSWIDADLHVLWLFVDDERSLDDEQLREVAEAAEAVLLIENAPLPLAVLLPDGRIALTNKAFADFLGYTPGELAGADIRMIMEDASNFAERWDSAMRFKGVTTDRQVRLRRRDGAAVTARAASLVVNDCEGQPRFVIARALSTRLEKAG